MKKYSLILLVMISLILITACQPAAAPQEEAQPTRTVLPTMEQTPTMLPTHTPTATPVPAWYLPADELDGVKISFFHPWTRDTARQIEILVDTFNQTNEWGIFVAVYEVGGAQQVFQQTEYGINNEDAPNVVIAPANELAYWQQQEKLTPLDDYLNDASYGMTQEEIAAFYPLFWEQDTLNDIRLGIPAARNTRFMVYNQSWAKELGHSMAPQTPTLLSNQTCAARDAILNDDRWQNDGVGGLIIDRNDYTVLSWLNAYDIADFPNDGTVYSFNQAAVEESFSYLRSMADEVCAWTSRNPTPFEYFANREALLYTAELQDLESQTNAMALIENRDQWTILPFPAKDGEPALMVYGPSYGIIGQSKQADLAAWLFIRWMNQPLPQKQLAQKLNSFPVTTNLLESIARARGPQWNTAVDLLDEAVPAPSGAWWRVGRFVLPDALYQVYGPNFTEEQYPELLGLLDETIQTLSSQPASQGW